MPLRIDSESDSLTSIYLTDCGFTLRKNSAVELKEFITKVQTRAMEVDTAKAENK